MICYFNPEVICYGGQQPVQVAKIKIFCQKTQIRVHSKFSSRILIILLHHLQFFMQQISKLGVIVIMK